MDPDGRITVLMCSPVGGIGGIASVTRTLAGWHWRHPDCGVRLELLAMDNPLHPSATGRECSAMVRMMRGARVYIPWLRHFAETLGRVLPDVVHVNSSGGAGHLRDLSILALCRRRGIPAVVQLHHGRCLTGFLPGELPMLRLVAGMSAGIVTLDSGSRERIGKLSAYHRVWVAGNPAPEVPDRVSSGNCDTCRLMYAGHISRMKGVDTLINTVRKMPGFTLDLFGPDLEGLTGDINCENGCGSNIIYHGVVERSKVLEAMAGRVFVLPSLTEGRPMTLLEALSVGSPVVATAVGGVPEMLGAGNGMEFSGMASAPCGILVEPGSGRWLEEGIVAVGKEMEATAARVREARRRAGDDYSAGRVAEELHRIWRLAGS